jgi:[acyl-carrier-protein] S-malonyltransferase
MAKKYTERNSKIGRCQGDALNLSQAGLKCSGCSTSAEPTFESRAVYGFLFPGQGAQYPGMGKDFYDQFSVARQTFEEADHFLNCAFSKLIFEGSLAELTLTKNSQIAIYITSIAILRVVLQQFPGLHPTVCAGLSLGEYTALTAAGKIAFADCLDLVRVRAEAMHRACEETEGSMQVVLGMTEEAAETVIRQLNPPHPIWIANLNCPGQIVIAGSMDALTIAAEALKQGGAKRVLPLEVSGAFHSGLMRSARDELAAKMESILFHESSIAVVMNVPGDFVLSAEQMGPLLIDQVTSPVRWERGVRKMMQRGIDVYIEMGPGKTLAGMNKRIGVAEPTYSLEKVADLEELNKMMELYATAES